MTSAVQAIQSNYDIQRSIKNDWDEIVAIIDRLKDEVLVTDERVCRNYIGTLKLKKKVTLRVFQAIHSLSVSNVITDDNYSTAKIQSRYMWLFKKSIADETVTVVMSVLVKEGLAYKQGPDYGLWIKGIWLAEVLFKLATRDPSYAEYTRPSLSPTIS